MDLQFAIVLDEAELAKLVQKVIDARPCRADSCGQNLLADGCGDRLKFSFLAHLGQHDEQSGETLFARIEQLVD